MFSSRMILSGCENTDGAIDRLVGIGVTNLAADTQDSVPEELLDCLSDEGMQKSLPQLGFIEQKPLLQPELSRKSEPEEIVQYR